MYIHNTDFEESNFMQSDASTVGFF